MRVYSLLLLVLLSAASKLYAQQPDTFHIYFDLNIPTLNNAARQHLDNLLYQEKIPRTGNVKIIGYADFLGTEADNQTLSENRAKNVQDYLTGFYVRKENVELCIGKGEVANKGIKTPDGVPKDRRVDIVINAPVDNHAIVPNKNTTKEKKSPGINLDTLKPGQALAMENMYFYLERHTLTPASEPQLEKLYTTLKENPKLKIRIEGHVCCIKPSDVDARDIDTRDACICLSVNRAKAVYDYLVNRGIAATRLKYAGYGRRKPLVAVERSLQDQDKNRRVEIRILEK